jgi:hypothetical protein
MNTKERPVQIQSPSGQSWEAVKIHKLAEKFLVSPLELASCPWPNVVGVNFRFGITNLIVVTMVAFSSGCDFQVFDNNLKTQISWSF